MNDQSSQQQPQQQRQPLIVTVTAVLPFHPLFSPHPSSLSNPHMNMNLHHGSTATTNSGVLFTNPAARNDSTTATSTRAEAIVLKPVAEGSDLMQGYVKVQAATGGGALSSTSSDSSAASTSSLSSDTDDAVPSDDFSDGDESLETNIAFLKEKQGLLQRFCCELLQDDLFQASAARQDIATQQEEEIDSLSSTSYTLSDDEQDDEDFLNSGVSIWVRAKKVLRSLSRHRGVLYHPASDSKVATSTNTSAKKRAATPSSDNRTNQPKSKKQRRVRFEEDPSSSSVSSDSSSEGDLERAAKCARRIIGRSPQGVRRISAADFELQAKLPPAGESSKPDAATISSSSSSNSMPTAEDFMLSLHTVLVNDAKPLPSIPYHTAG